MHVISEFLEQARTFLFDNPLINTLVLLISESQLSSLLASSRPVREMQKHGIKLFVISELSEMFISDCFSEIIQLKLNPKDLDSIISKPDVAIASGMFYIESIKTSLQVIISPSLTPHKFFITSDTKLASIPTMQVFSRVQS
jgi:hypothetical protein